jgi:redox-sensing transcriptional repressor
MYRYSILSIKEWGYLMERKEISKSVLKRLPGYLAYLKSIPEGASTYISATALANALGMGEVQVRKDLAMVCDGGRPKIGYPREVLIEDIEQFLGYDNTTDAVLIGAGKLGQALLGYSGFAAYGLNILAAFDVNPGENHSVDGKPILPIDQLESFCRTHKVLMGIITVPVEQAQAVCDQLIGCGIKAIWTFAPTHLEVSSNILVQHENMATSLAVLSMHLQAQIKEKK